MTRDLAIDVERLTKTFGPKRALDAVTLRIERGAFVALLGRNGAGKTTLIRVLTGLYQRDSGRVRVAGFDPGDGRLELKRSLGVMPDDGGLPDRLSGPQYVRFVGRMFGLDEATIATRRAELFERLDLHPEPGALIGEYSFGMKKKVALSAALLHAPEIVILDEPFEGLDALTARTLKEMLTALSGRGVTVLLSSHALDTVERLCPSIAIVDEGRCLVHERTATLLAGREGQSLEQLFVGLLGGAREGSLSWL